MGILKHDEIYDESGIIVGSAPIGEQRPERETTDIELPNILDDDVLPTSGIIVVEHCDVISRNNFVCEYLQARDK